MNAPPDPPGTIRLGLGVAFASVAAVSALPPFLTESKDGLLLKLKVQPRASRNKLGDAVGDEWRVWVTAPPVDAAANKAVLELLAEELDLAKSQVQLVRGDTARHKVVRITGLSAAELLQRAGGGSIRAARVERRGVAARRIRRIAGRPGRPRDRGGRPGGSAS